MVGLKEKISSKLLKPNSDPLNVVIVRPFSRQISTRLASTRVTPNQVTLAALLSAIAASLVIVFFDSLVGAVLAALLIQLYLILDCADGELARLKGMKSDFGKWFDGVVDTVATGLLIAAFAFRAASIFGSDFGFALFSSDPALGGFFLSPAFAIALGFAAAIGFFTANFSYQYGELVFAKTRSETVNAASAKSQGGLNFVSILKSFSPGGQMLLLTLGAVFSLHLLALAFYALWANAVWIARVFKYRKMRG